MATSFNLHIRSADRDFYEGECVGLTLALPDGQLGLLANHSPMVAAVVPGLLTYRPGDGTAVTVAAGSGVVRFENNDALVLLDSVERPEDIDVARAEAAVEHAREALRRSKTRQEKLQAQSDLARARNRLKAAERAE
ncbi:MAG: ATP synthase F1 subunit epsilon [Oscillospiraceae bacterium]|nr:ATP synthase F1 subunit epsilon [Oscillospiraceae bacterium]